jgi:flagellar biosynthesis GTPase FlhF
MAQFIWINERGIKQYSDKPPPANTPKDKIIKGLQAPVLASKNPSANSNNSSTSIGADGSAVPNVNANTNQDSNKVNETPRQLMQKKIAAQEEEFTKYKKAREEEEKKEQEEREQKLEKEKTCSRALSYKQSLEMAGPITIFNKKGEKEILSDEARKKDLEEAQKILSECKP